MRHLEDVVCLLPGILLLYNRHWSIFRYYIYALWVSRKTRSRAGRFWLFVLEFNGWGVFWSLLIRWLRKSNRENNQNLSEGEGAGALQGQTQIFSFFVFVISNFEIFFITFLHVSVTSMIFFSVIEALLIKKYLSQVHMTPKNG